MTHSSIIQRHAF